MDIQYKVCRETVDGASDTWWFDTLSAANKKYRTMQRERTLKTLWAEIWETDYDVEGGNWERRCGFEREKIVLLDKPVLTGRYFDY